MKNLDIAVTLQAKGSSIQDGLWFSYYQIYPIPTGTATKGYLKDAAGNIEIPGNGIDDVQISFHLKTPQLTVGGVAYRASFQLANDAEAGDTLAIKQGIEDALTDIFHPPKLASSSATGGIMDKVYTISLKRDDVTYDYTLKVGLTPPGGRTKNVEHDPKIKNGGTAFHWGMDNPMNAVAVLAFGALALLAYQRLLKRNHPA